MRAWARLALVLTGFALAAVSLGEPDAASRSFCAEWIRQSREAYERVTLFADQTLIWKTRAVDGTENLQRKTISAEELKFYCDFFARPAFWELPPDFRTKLNAEFVAESVITVTRGDGTRRDVRFDDLSTLSLDALTLRAALQGLRALFSKTIAPASKFAPERLTPGTGLTRLDGATFRVRMIDPVKGVVELEGVSEPFSFFCKIDELRFLFEAPERGARNGPEGPEVPERKPDS